VTVGLASIVEGHGDVAALPVLLRRLAYEQDRYDVEFPKPVRCSKSEIVTEEGHVRADRLKRRVRQALIKLDRMDRGAVLLLLDADDQCPKVMAPRIQQEACLVSAPVPLAVVLANREFEAWFLAALESLRGERGIPDSAVPPENPESVRDAKGALRLQMGGKYSERVDQPALAANLDFQQAATCRSFRKFRCAAENLLGQL